MTDIVYWGCDKCGTIIIGGDIAARAADHRAREHGQDDAGADVPDDGLLTPLEARGPDDPRDAR
jgi:hypothetical protein